MLVIPLRMDDNNKYCTNKFQDIYRIITFSHESTIIIIKQFRTNLQIDNHKERGNPNEDAELDEVILDEALGGGNAKPKTIIFCRYRRRFPQLSEKQE